MRPGPDRELACDRSQIGATLKAIRTSRQFIRDVVSSTPAVVDERARDEMAIPSYLHANPLVRWLMWKRLDAIVTFADLDGSEAVLDFGCGLGLLLPTIGQRARLALATDLFPDYAKSLSERLGLKIPFPLSLDEVPRASLDLIVAADVLEHVDDPELYLREFAHRLRCGGRVIISGPTETSLYRLGRLVAGFGGKAEYHHTNIDSLVDTATRCGYKAVRMRQVPTKIVTLFKVVELRAPAV